MTKVGSHFTLDACCCDSEKLNDLQFLRSTLLDAARCSGCEVLHEHFHQFTPQGVSGFVMIAESHIAIHTWPEFGYAALDVFTCGTRVKPGEILQLIVSRIGGGPHDVHSLSRGYVTSHSDGSLSIVIEEPDR